MRRLYFNTSNPARHRIYRPPCIHRLKLPPAAWARLVRGQALNGRRLTTGMHPETR